MLDGLSTSQPVEACEITETAAVQMSPSIFWVVTQGMLVVIHQRFETDYQSHLQVPGSPRRPELPDMSHS